MARWRTPFPIVLGAVAVLISACGGAAPSKTGTPIASVGAGGTDTPTGATTPSTLKATTTATPSPSPTAVKLDKCDFESFVKVCMTSQWEVTYARGREDWDQGPFPEGVADKDDTIEFFMEGPVAAAGDMEAILVLIRHQEFVPASRLREFAMSAAEHGTVIQEGPLSGDPPGYVVAFTGVQRSGEFAGRAYGQLTLNVNRAEKTYEFRFVTPAEEFSAQLPEAMEIIKSVRFLG